MILNLMILCGKIIWLKKYYLPRNISSKLCDLIKNEDFTG